MTDSVESGNMYVPAAYAAADPRVIVREFPFGTLVTCGETPFATLVTMFFESDEPDEMRLVGHLARRNPHAQSLESGQRALAIFSGPHAYISASWYRERPTVPTWNYISAQVGGVLEPIDDPKSQLAILSLTAQQLETGNDQPWELAHAPPGRVAELLPLIRSFRIQIDSIAGATKLSQAQPASDRKRVIDALEERGHSNDLEIAQRMRALFGLD